MSKYGTPFIESEVVLAYQSGDVDYAREQLNLMSISELKTFRLQLSRLPNLCAEIINAKIDADDGFSWDYFEEDGLDPRNGMPFGDK